MKKILFILFIGVSSFGYSKDRLETHADRLESAVFEIGIGMEQIAEHLQEVRDYQEDILRLLHEFVLIKEDMFGEMASVTQDDPPMRLTGMSSRQSTE